ncbi:hypothetical protein AwErysi_05190 [Erysipelotrichaceae bacterium]|nr:hypothetical protein AwErysi_05190 [Erysipelotrichaceae bacterium]
MEPKMKLKTLQTLQIWIIFFAVSVLISQVAMYAAKTNTLMGTVIFIFSITTYSMLWVSYVKARKGFKSAKKYLILVCLVTVATIIIGLVGFIGTSTVVIEAAKSGDTLSGVSPEEIYLRFPVLETILRIQVGLSTLFNIIFLVISRQIFFLNKGEMGMYAMDNKDVIEIKKDADILEVIEITETDGEKE